MKKILIAGLAVTLLFTGCTQQAQENDNVFAIEQGEDQNKLAGTRLQGFEAKELKGGKVDESLFSKSELTVLNLWGTFCSPCIEEMPDLEVVSKAYTQDKVQVVGLITDGENVDEAKKIVDKLGITYANLLADETLMKTVVNKFDYVPVTLFVDQNGQVLDTFIPGGTNKDDLTTIIDGLLKEKATKSELVDNGSKTEEIGAENVDEENSDEHFDDDYTGDFRSFEEVMGLDIHQLTESQINELRGMYTEIENFEYDEDGSNESAYNELLDAFDYKMREFGLSVPYYSYGEVADVYYDDIKAKDYDTILKLDEQHYDLMDSYDEDAEEEIEAVVEKIEGLFDRNGLPGEEISNQVGNQSIHYAIYDVSKGQIKLDQEGMMPHETLSDEEVDLYNRLWVHIKKIVPQEYMNLLVKFEVNTDGIDNVMAHVVEETDDYSKWRLAIDLKDAITADGQFSDEFTNTVIHEFAHVMTLHKGELQGETIVDEEAFSTQEGYLKTASYLNQFYQKFWTPIWAEHEAATEQDAETGDGEAIYALYEKYEDQFVSDYAATNPGEDIAETYRVFVMEDKPTGHTIRDQKINFMYEFEELVKIRSDIRRALNID